MRAEWIKLNSFLNHEATFVQFGAGLNVVEGANAAGKTNLLDGIYYTSLGRTSRQSKDKELLRWGSGTGASVEVRVRGKYGGHTVQIYVDLQGKKRIAVDGLPLTRVGELMGVVRVVFFAPDEMRLVKESPGDRRRFFDLHLAQSQKRYFYALRRYQKALAQRNVALKQYRGDSLEAALGAVDGTLAETGAFLHACRARFAAELAPFVGEAHARLSGKKEEIQLKYESSALPTTEEMAQKLRLSRAADVEMGFTTVGVHRDDLKISLDGVDLRKYGSQGQQRSAVLSLKLAEVYAERAKTGETPILLLDDVLSELDAERREALLDAIEGVQTILTCTEFPKGESTYRKIAVEGGKVIATEEIHGR